MHLRAVSTPLSILGSKLYMHTYMCTTRFQSNSKLVRRGNIITLFIFITVLCGTNNIPRNIIHAKYECEEYFVEYC